MGLKSIHKVYFLICTIVIVCVIATLIFVGFVQPVVSEETNETEDTAWDVLYLGIISSEVTLEERERRVQTFIEHNAGVFDACTIMHFYSSHCPACMQLEPWLDAFRERYPEVVFQSYEAREYNYQVLRGLANMEYGTDTLLVPSIYICGTVLQGLTAIEQAFEPMSLAVYDLPVRS